MADGELSVSDALMLEAEAAIQSKDSQAIFRSLGSISAWKKEMDQQYVMLTREQTRLNNSLVTGDPDKIPNVPESS